ncbi:TPA: restriction endonuclease subunit S [Citrobacter farmeri]|uniref:restriction endonuclease subunit S n=1 Tax=Citrobacter farmeri TaxID=67824 RepID=UPI001A1E0049|nr:restriction endonuclease subunit S [Citrobacter farmeri]MBU5647854.1 restriction endonuclease subunit S [Pluralibacter sp. S54_ASV_43]HAT3757400.1 restriction endonuclease subunit S [Citrobacter amalonaticus]HAU5703819.1 restriction endonuclease subunit S [Citrobacter freundii]QZE47559.1 restriction endonuclease subunit S [Citrobacter farmeri]HCB1594089.1 restriction endonuclease subunit S [Citrobacter farmeri]
MTLKWEKVRLGDVAELQRGFDLPSTKRIEGEIPIVSSSGITGFHVEAKAKAPGVVTGRYGSIGDVFYLEQDFWPLNTSLWVKDFHGNDEKFIYFLLSNFDFKKFSDKTGVPGVNRNDLHAVNVLLPPFLEQKKIAQILSTWDKAISVTEKLLTNSQQQKKALMQQLLTGKKRLLDDNGTRFSEIWGLYALSKLFQRVTTKNNGKSTNVVTISGQHGLIKQEDFFKKTVASDTLDGYFLLKKGQFAYNKSYSNGYPMGAIKRLNRYPEGVVTTLYICFELSTPKESFGDYWEHYFESGLLNNSLSQIAHEGGRAHGLLNVKPSDFFSLKVPVPGFEEQQKIAAVLSVADAEIATLEKKLACLKDEKKALMQQLLTGKRRVKVEAEEAVSA